jgi:hypothetical protein
MQKQDVSDGKHTPQKYDKTSMGIIPPTHTEDVGGG